MESRIKKTIMIVTALIFIFAAAACGDNNGSVTVTVITPEAEDNPSLAPSIEPLKTPAGEGLLDPSIAGKPVNDSGITLKEVWQLVGLSKDELKNKYGGDLELTGRNEISKQCVYEYENKKLGLNIVCGGPGFDEHYVNIVELDKNKLSFNGIRSDSDFKEVTAILGDTEVRKNQDGLPGLFSYELRYKAGDIYLRIYSYDEAGNGGIYMSAAGKFAPEYRKARITPEQISGYMQMTMDEVKEKLGEGEEEEYSISYSLNYPQYGADFWFNKQNKEMIGFSLSPAYEINELRQEYTLEKSIEIMGKGTVKEFSGEEDYYRSVKYDFSDFTLELIDDANYGLGSYWKIEKK